MNSRIVCFLFVLFVAVSEAFVAPGNYARNNWKRVNHIDEDEEKTITYEERLYNTTYLDMVVLTINDAPQTYFFGSNQKMSWMEAMQFCQSFKMDIASIETKAEHTEIINYLANELGVPTIPFWISGNKIGRSTYLWLSDAFMIYSSWAVGKPSNFSVNCMYEANAHWYDSACETRYNFICEVPPQTKSYIDIFTGLFDLFD